MSDRATDKRNEAQGAVEAGGPPCDEAQADGVPCEELGRDCEDCEKAEPQAEETTW